MRRRAGTWVQDSVAGSPADEAGLREGSDRRRFRARTICAGEDIITAGNGKKLADEAAPGIALLDFSPGEEVTLQVYRDGKPRAVRVKLGARPLQAGIGARP